MPKLKIFVAGHKGMVGSAIIRQLKIKDVDIITRDRKELDLLNQQDVQNFFKNEKIDQVYLAAAKVGGIYANNTYPADFIYQNLMIQNNVIHNAFLNRVKKLLFLGSSCIYPKNSKQPIEEEELLTGKLEPTNEPYAISKIAGIKMCESYNRQFSVRYKIDYRSIMPTNLYGPGDNYDPENSHVIPGLIRRFHEAKLNKLSNVLIWGSGTAKRDFLHVDDMAKACIFFMNLKKKTVNENASPMCSHFNIGSGKDLTIKELASIIRDIVGFKGQICFDKSKPDGTPRKILNSDKINNLGFKPVIDLKEGLIQTYNTFLGSE